MIGDNDNAKISDFGLARNVEETGHYKPTHVRYQADRYLTERVAEWLRRLTRKPKVRTAVGSNPTLDSLVAVRNTSPGRPEPCEGNLVAVAGSCGGLMVKHPWPLLEISLSDFRGLATLNINTYLPT